MQTMSLFLWPGDGHVAPMAAAPSGLLFHLWPSDSQTGQEATMNTSLVSGGPCAAILLMMSAWTWRPQCHTEATAALPHLALPGTVWILYIHLLEVVLNWRKYTYIYF